jgi:hypothetical protein
MFGSLLRQEITWLGAKYETEFPLAKTLIEIHFQPETEALDPFLAFWSLIYDAVPSRALLGFDRQRNECTRPRHHLALAYASLKGDTYRRLSPHRGEVGLFFFFV